jgi:hypothetical protein
MALPEERRRRGKKDDGPGSRDNRSDGKTAAQEAKKTAGEPNYPSGWKDGGPGSLKNGGESRKPIREESGPSGKLKTGAGNKNSRPDGSGAGRKGAEPGQKKPAGIGVFAKSTKVEPSSVVLQTSIPFWMTRFAWSMGGHRAGRPSPHSGLEVVTVNAPIGAFQCLASCRSITRAYAHPVVTGGGTSTRRRIARGNCCCGPVRTQDTDPKQRGKD